MSKLKNKQWEKIVNDFFKDFNKITDEANDYGMSGELSMMALETFMGYVLNNNCIHTLQNTLNSCYDKTIDFHIEKLKEHKKFKVGRRN